MAQYLTQNAVWWTEEAGLDGIRLDTFPYVGRQFWHGFHEELHTLYPKLTTVGEVFNADPTITSAFAGGAVRTGLDLNIDTGLDTPFDFPSYFALRDVFLNNAPMTRLADVLRLDGLYPHSRASGPVPRQSRYNTIYESARRYSTASQPRTNYSDHDARHAADLLRRRAGDERRRRSRQPA